MIDTDRAILDHMADTLRPYGIEAGTVNTFKEHKWCLYTKRTPHDTINYRLIAEVRDNWLSMTDVCGYYRHLERRWDLNDPEVLDRLVTDLAEIVDGYEGKKVSPMVTASQDLYERCFLD